MSRYDVEHNNDLVDRLFCRPSAPYGPYERIGPAVAVVPDMLVRAVLHRPGDESDRFELSLFVGIEGFAGELWERASRSLRRLRALDHPGLPQIERGRFDPAERVAFNLTREIGNPMDIDATAKWAAKHPIEAFEQFSVLIDALSHLHGIRILHRNLTLGALRFDPADGQVRLSRFEMSTLIGNIIRRIGARDEREARSLAKTIYLTPPDGVDPARHLAYLAPELHPYVFDEHHRGRRDWEVTDVFGLGVLGWEWFCGPLPRKLPEQLAAVREAEGTERAVALGRLHQAMRVHLANRPDLPEPLTSLLRDMIEPQPESRETSYRLARQVEEEWEPIRGVWEADLGERPYLVAFMPDWTNTTMIVEQNAWVSRSPDTRAGRDELRAFLQDELRKAELVWSPVGARGYASGRDEVLADAEWVLVGEKAVWFCAFLYEQGGMSRDRGQMYDDVLLIKYLRERERADLLAAARPRRRVPALDLIAYHPGQNLDQFRVGRPSWSPLTESVKSNRRRDAEDEEFLQSLDFLLEYQQVELDARLYPFTTPGPERGGGLAQAGDSVLLWWDEQRDDPWRHRSALLTAYAASSRRRPDFGDFFEGLVDQTEEETLLLEVDAGIGTPASGNDRVRVLFLSRKDARTIAVRPLGGARVPSRGWIRPAGDGGSRTQLNRQTRARLELERPRQAGLVRSLRRPESSDFDRRRWSLQAEQDLKGDTPLKGNTPQVIGDMLSLDPFYALQGPPGSGKTTAVAHALRRYLEGETGARVLVSAQSNFALDHLAERLIQQLPEDTLILRETPPGKDEDVVKTKAVWDYTLGNLTSRVAADVKAKLLKGGDVTDSDADGRKLSSVERKLADKLAKEWVDSVESDQVELAERIRHGAGVVLATCSIAATVLEDAREHEVFDWVIVEEAAKAWPTELIIPLVFGVRWTLVGDHRQLGPYRSETVQQFLESLHNHTNPEIQAMYASRAKRLEVLNLFGTLFERAPADIGSAGETAPLGRLTTQFRMHGRIAEPVSRVFYPKEPPALDGGLPASFLQSYPLRRPDHGVTAPREFAGQPLVWVDTDGREDCFAMGRWYNDGEVKLVEAIVARMRPPPAALGRDDGSLAVLTPYRAQLQRLERRGVLRDRVYTVQSFQGQEADRVIVSLVRDTHRGDTVVRNIGHVGQDEVANVLLSRGRRLLVLVGSLNHLAEHGGPSWAELIRIIRHFGHVVDASDWDLG